MMSSPPTSPRLSSNAAMRRKNTVPPGFRAPLREKPKPISEMSVRELQDRYAKNSKTLSSPGASTSTYAQRIAAEQVAIVSQLEIHGMDVINTGMMNTRIGDNIPVPHAPESPMSRAIDAKRRALARFGDTHGAVGSLNVQEAIDIEQRAHAQDRERQQKLIEKRRRQGLPVKGEVLTRAEVEARLWAFMNHKPTESDLEEEEDDDDDDDDDPATWFDDDQDDGRKGQDIVEPDEEDLSEIIRIDHNKLCYSTFYEPRYDGD
ncbi:hypothetical protein E1B28_004482 [Marasmius oreades]|uniref:Uncharacterized protein n=1 Tax=Marasmius oreades TaxID=181124 RepID=A0A9P7UYU8_9AGAR|nr:uncharacterized protein E1B28_004482 [Marasmius oreades]KAG7097098.1 hypothetical protein E1B28_004482 [Marasmius oreades]